MSSGIWPFLVGWLVIRVNILFLGMDGRWHNWVFNWYGCWNNILLQVYNEYTILFVCIADSQALSSDDETMLVNKYCPDQQFDSDCHGATVKYLFVYAILRIHQTFGTVNWWKIKIISALRFNIENYTLLESLLNWPNFLVAICCQPIQQYLLLVTNQLNTMYFAEQFNCAV